MLRLLSATCQNPVWRRSITGAILSALNLSAAELLAEIGLTPERVFALLQEGAAWAIPNIVLGSLVIVPIWFVTYLLAIRIVDSALISGLTPRRTEEKILIGSVVAPGRR
jgi:hypothetical protein